MFTYFNPKLLQKLLNGENLDQNLYFIGSVGDVYLATDSCKEGLGFAEFEKLFSSVCLLDDHVNFHIQELGKVELLEGMFNTGPEGDVTLDEEVTNIIKSPHYTINYIALKPKENISFWDHDVLQQMIDWYND